MTAVDFPERNVMLVENQPEYETLPVFVETKEIMVQDPDHPEKPAERKEVPWSMTSCFELSPAEIEEVVRTGKFWHTQMVMGNYFQPIRMSTQNPFIQP